MTNPFIWRIKKMRPTGETISDSPSKLVAETWRQPRDPNIRCLCLLVYHLFHSV